MDERVKTEEEKAQAIRDTNHTFWSTATNGNAHSLIDAAAQATVWFIFITVILMAVYFLLDLLGNDTLYP